MIDPPIHMPVLQCYTCYNVTRADLEGNISVFLENVMAEKCRMSEGIGERGDIMKKFDEMGENCHSIELSPLCLNYIKPAMYSFMAGSQLQASW